MGVHKANVALPGDSTAKARTLCSRRARGDQEEALSATGTLDTTAVPSAGSRFKRQRHKHSRDVSLDRSVIVVVLDSTEATGDQAAKPRGSGC